MESLENVFTIEWKGPYYDVLDIRKEDFENSFYLISGLHRYERTVPNIQYCGISSKRSIFNRLSDKGHKHNDIKRNKEIWIGCFSNIDLNTESNIRLVEHLIIRYWQPKDNERKKNRNPETPVCIINRWKNTKDQFRQNRSYPAQYLDDVILFDGNSFWITQRLKRVDFE